MSRLNPVYPVLFGDCDENVEHELASSPTTLTETVHPSLWGLRCSGRYAYTIPDGILFGSAILSAPIQSRLVDRCGVSHLFTLRISPLGLFHTPSRTHRSPVGFELGPAYHGLVKLAYGGSSYSLV
jgi:hypothetical protein